MTTALVLLAAFAKIAAWVVPCVIGAVVAARAGGGEL